MAAASVDYNAIDAVIIGEGYHSCSHSRIINDVTCDATSRCKFWFAANTNGTLANFAHYSFRTNG
jgi:hypothetical protein